LALSEATDTVVDPDTTDRLFLTIARPSWGRRRDLDMANPRAAISAFCAAFRAGSGPRLQVVVTGGRCAAEAEACRDLAGGRTDVAVIETDDEAEIAAMAASAHCYISLHRSSAFNLDLARALGSGRPVVATRYGGPMDYLREDNAELVGFELVPLRGHLLEMVPGATWADPDIDEAARALRNVTLDYREACQRAWSGRSLITRTYTRRNVNKTLLRRLAFVAGGTGTQKAHPQSR
jgi:glycosyltransferase involved in cell wall biosynthesis